MEFITQDILTKQVWMWAAFLVIVVVLLIFIGSKIFVADLMGWRKFPAAVSLGVTFAILAGEIFWSLWRTRSVRADGAAS